MPESCMDKPDCMAAEEIRSVTIDDRHLSMISEYLLHDWPLMRIKVQKGLQLHWKFRYEILIISGTAMKGKGITIPTSFQEKALNQLQINYFDIEKTRLLTCVSIYRTKMTAVIDIRYSYKLPYMSWFLSNTTWGQNRTTQNTREAMVVCWSWYLYH